MKYMLMIGNTGAGKSALGNRILSLKGASQFVEYEGAESGTNITESKTSTWNATDCCITDTPGLNSSEGIDAPHMKQMVEYIKENLKKGIHGFILVFNSQSPRFDESLKKMIRLYISLINSHDFWTHMAMVFTRCYAAVPMTNGATKAAEYTKILQGMYKEVYPSSAFTPAINSYFVDSHDMADQKTKDDLNFLYGWLLGSNPINNASFVIPDPIFWKKKAIQRPRIIGSMQKQVGTERRKVGSHQETWSSHNIFKGFKKSVTVDDYADVPIYKTEQTIIMEEAFEGVSYDGKTPMMSDWKVVPGSERKELK
jgi:hypothetical protein